MRLRYRFTNMLCLVAALSGCMGWHTSTVDPATLIDRDHPGAMRVTRHDRSRVILYKPVVEGDSLHGRRGRNSMALPLSDVSSIATMKTHVAATAVGVTLATVFAALAIAIAATFPE